MPTTQSPRWTYKELIERLGRESPLSEKTMLEWSCGCVAVEVEEGRYMLQSFDQHAKLRPDRR